VAQAGSITRDFARLNRNGATNARCHGFGCCAKNDHMISVALTLLPLIGAPGHM